MVDLLQVGTDIMVGPTISLCAGTGPGGAPDFFFSPVGRSTNSIIVKSTVCFEVKLGNVGPAPIFPELFVGANGISLAATWRERERKSRWATVLCGIGTR